MIPVYQYLDLSTSLQTSSCAIQTTDEGAFIGMTPNLADLFVRVMNTCFDWEEAYEAFGPHVEALREIHTTVADAVTAGDSIFQNN